MFLIWRRALDSTLSPIDKEKYKYDTQVKIVKARERRNENEVFTLVYNPETSRLSEKVEGD